MRYCLCLILGGLLVTCPGWAEPEFNLHALPGVATQTVLLDDEPNPEDGLNFYGKWNPQFMDKVLKSTVHLAPGERVGAISHYFLDTPYKANTLIGDKEAREILVVNLSAVDPFTLIDYVEALRQSVTAEDFRPNLIRVRYSGGMIRFDHRHRFFSLWLKGNTPAVRDVTARIGKNNVVKTTRNLNQRTDTRKWIDGLPVTPVKIVYIPRAAVDASVLKQLKTGDYLGFVSDKPGLDMRNMGIVIQTKSNTLLRHASSLYPFYAVIDTPLKQYLTQQVGIVIARPE